MLKMLGRFSSVEIEARSSVAEIVNCTIDVNCNLVSQRGIYISDGGGPITIRGNVIVMRANWGTSIEATGQAVSVSYCYLYCSTPAIGVQPANCLFYVDPQLSGPDLLPGPPCINAGPPEAIYNDRDGSRNDLGYTGGPLYNPANYTNNNPMVFFLTGSPQMVFKGAQTNIQVNVGASAGH